MPSVINSFRPFGNEIRPLSNPCKIKADVGIEDIIKKSC